MAKKMVQASGSPKLVVGTRVYADGQQEGKPAFSLNGLLSESVAVTTMGIYCGWMNILILLFIASFFYRSVLVVFVCICSTVLLPAKPVLWPAWNRMWVFRTWRQYFNYSYFFEELLDPKKRYILYEAPHGAYPIGPITAGTLCQTFFPDAPIYSVAATSVFHIPFWRHFVAWIGSMPATKANFKNLLRKGSVAVVIGGIAEMFMSHPSKERIKMQGRKGFVRIALEEQIDGIVPVYYFGQSQVFSFGPTWLAGISRKMRVSVGVLLGRWGLPVPRKIPIYLVHGKPIPVPKVDKSDPKFNDHVDQLLAASIQGMQDLYLRHRAEYGWPDRPLSIE
eukprot:CAMPEP_0119107254 /NCGR_PEP_ID=MMETSP1180-20130426/9602_1 /TAXON_ID=3052 ORGANISM="Chlamydomonas cf sp, Strain CCMP681" /NCGR_SAMPLE_ID=MMETSP1180 /ASSEMBLY_ACC=CAM_ASM_000741 /LENGTH=335 /DNA_ID=CAMNT_0007092715 /DNA_START=5 /DNA_END=1012 /DNA_ORIENTATION=+